MRTWRARRASPEGGIVSQVRGGAQGAVSVARELRGEAQAPGRADAARRPEHRGRTQGGAQASGALDEALRRDVEIHRRELGERRVRARAARARARCSRARAPRDAQAMHRAAVEGYARPGHAAVPFDIRGRGRLAGEPTREEEERRVPRRVGGGADGASRARRPVLRRARRVQVVARRGGDGGQGVRPARGVPGRGRAARGSRDGRGVFTFTSRESDRK